MNIKIKDLYCLHKEYNLELSPGYTALVGPNGAGKTTLLHQLYDYAKTKHIRVWSYDNLTDGGQRAKQRFLNNSNVECLAASMVASEGEQIAIGFGDRVTDLGRTVHEIGKGGETLFVLLDAIDSGASIDRARDLRALFDLIQHNDISTGSDVYIVMAVNHFEMAKAADCVNVRTGEHIRFDDYDSYAEFICSFEDKYKRKSASQKRKRKTI